MVDKQISKEQLKELKTVFAMFDKDDSGAISVDELADVMRALGQDPDEDALQQTLRRVDMDGNGSIEFPEFVQMMYKLSTAVKEDEDDEEELRDVFRTFDKDGDGFITSTELKNVLMAVGEDMTEDEVEQVMTMADRNGDGKVDFEEFADIVRGKIN